MTSKRNLELKRKRKIARQKARQKKRQAQKKQFEEEGMTEMKTETCIQVQKTEGTQEWNDCLVYEYEASTHVKTKIRIMIDESDSAPWWVFCDVCNALSGDYSYFFYKLPLKDAQTIKIIKTGKIQKEKLRIINKEGLLALLQRYESSEVKNFNDWTVNKVIPNLIEYMNSKYGIGKGQDIIETEKRKALEEEFALIPDMFSEEELEEVEARRTRNEVPIKNPWEEIRRLQPICANRAKKIRELEKENNELRNALSTETAIKETTISAENKIAKQNKEIEKLRIELSSHKCLVNNFISVIPYNTNDGYFSLGLYTCASVFSMEIQFFLELLEVKGITEKITCGNGQEFFMPSEYSLENGIFTRKESWSGCLNGDDYEINYTQKARVTAKGFLRILNMLDFYSLWEANKPQENSSHESTR